MYVYSLIWSPWVQQTSQFTPLVLELSLTQSRLLWGEFSICTLCCSYSQSLQFSFLVPPGTHHCWVDRDDIIWEACPTPRDTYLGLSDHRPSLIVAHGLLFGSFLPNRSPWASIWRKHCYDVLGRNCQIKAHGPVFRKPWYWRYVAKWSIKNYCWQDNCNSSC